mmetsp:Transcript_18272/g.54538  ORF Transcript_18272/g.54538 Transcript_18272/m.54538 type:complete len:87 (-) Transcript_18272:283-543(-)|eukprot:359453-Chlamydomonas_euryale.AAC.6
MSIVAELWSKQVHLSTCRLLRPCSWLCHGLHSAMWLCGEDADEAVVKQLMLAEAPVAGLTVTVDRPWSARLDIVVHGAGRPMHNFD